MVATIKNYFNKKELFRIIVISKANRYFFSDSPPLINKNPPSRDTLSPLKISFDSLQKDAFPSRISLHTGVFQKY